MSSRLGVIRKLFSWQITSNIASKAHTVPKSVVTQPAQVGYTGGTKKFPTYHNLGDHTESVEIMYDPEKTTYEKMLAMFWNNHDSTACLNRQYMSAIFYHSEAQKELAEKTRDEHQKKLTRQIQTKIKPAETFYSAEDYHQKYMLRQQRNLLSSLGFNQKEMLNGHAATRLNGYVGGFGKMDDLMSEISKLGLDDSQVKMVQSRLRQGGMS